MKRPQRPAGPKARKKNRTNKGINPTNGRKGFRGKGKGPSFEDILENLLMPMVLAYQELTYDFPSVKEVVSTSILACIQRTTINTVCDYIDDGKSSRTILHYLGCLDLEKVEKRVNELLRKDILEFIKEKWVRLSLDLVNIPYYGEAKDKEEELRKTKAKKGTSTFHSYMTAYAVVRNHRYTIAVRYVRAGEKVEDVFKEVMDEICSLDLTIKGVFLDKEFYQVRVINYLKEMGLPTIIAVPQRGKKIKALRVRSEGARTVDWTARNVHREEATFDLQCYQKYTKGSKVLGGGATWFFYATISMSGKPKWMANEYRRRFGIESSYRMMDKCRARTSSKDPAIRLFFVLIAFMIVNLKVLYEWFSVKDGRVSREESTALMRLNKLRRIIRTELEKWFSNRNRRKRRVYLEGW